MAAIGSTIPNTTFIQVPYDAEADKAGACGIPSPVNTHEAFKGKKVVVIAVVSTVMVKAYILRVH